MVRHIYASGWDELNVISKLILMALTAMPELFASAEDDARGYVTLHPETLRAVLFGGDDGVSDEAIRFACYELEDVGFIEVSGTDDAGHPLYGSVLPS